MVVAAGGSAVGRRYHQNGSGGLAASSIGDSGLVKNSGGNGGAGFAGTRAERVLAVVRAETVWLPETQVSRLPREAAREA